MSLLIGLIFGLLVSIVLIVRDNFDMCNREEYEERKEVREKMLEAFEVATQLIAGSGIIISNQVITLESSQEEDPKCWNCKNYYEDPYNSGKGSQECEKGKDMKECDSCQFFECIEEETL